MYFLLKFASKIMIFVNNILSITDLFAALFSTRVKSFNAFITILYRYQTSPKPMAVDDLKYR